jgi:transcription elongation factor GreA
MNNILTEENIKKLREELDYRMTVKRAQIAKEKLEAAAHGDRSENAEYKRLVETIEKTIIEFNIY